jgi:hypothetical protein
MLMIAIEGKLKAAIRLASIRVDTRSEFASFLEDVAITMKAGALKAPVVNYMFGYYAILCWKSEPFWVNLREGKDDPDWALLRKFACQMAAERELLHNTADSGQIAT